MFNDFHYSSEHFFDRIEDTKFMCDEIYSSEQSKVILLCAESGTGKSSLIKNVLKKVYGNCIQTIIHVTMPPINNNSTSEKYFFLEQCFLEFEKTFHSTKKLSFQYYFLHGINKLLRKEIFNKIIDDVRTSSSIFGVMLYSISMFLKKILKLGDFNYLRIFQDANSPQYILKHDYIKYIFSNINILLCIENIHLIDNLSLQCFIEWFTEFKNKPNYYCLEYTITDFHNSENAIKLSSYLKKSGVDVIYRKLNILESQYALEILRTIRNSKDNQYIFEQKALAYYESSFIKGNLIKLIDFAQEYTDAKQIIGCYDSTLEKFLQVKNTSCLYIISIIILCGGSISIAMLEAFVKKSRFIQQEKFILLIKTMHSENFICIKDEIISIYHASMIDTWYQNEENHFFKYNLLAYRELEIFVKNCIHNDISIYQSHDRSLILLIKLYNQYEPIKLLNILDDLEYLLIKSLTIESAWVILGTIISITKERISENTSLFNRILKLCFTCELYEKGYQYIQLIENKLKEEKPLFYIQKCIFLTALEKHEESINILQGKIKIFSNKQQFMLNAYNIMIHNFRSLNRMEECRNIASIILNSNEFNSLTEYGYFLRLTDLYEKNIGKIITNLQFGIKFFIEKGMHIQAAKTRISYVMQLSLINRLNEAKKQLMLAEQYLNKHKYIAPHMILVNKVAIAFLMGVFGDDLWNKLQEAEQSVSIPFDELAILNNKVIWTIERRAYQKVPVLESRIIRLLNFEPDKHMHAIINYNLYVLFNRIGNEKISKKYYKKAWELRENCTSLKMRLEKKKDTSPRSFLLDKPWHVCFLAYWTYDLIHD